MGSGVVSRTNPDQRRLDSAVERQWERKVGGVKCRLSRAMAARVMCKKLGRGTTGRPLRGAGPIGDAIRAARAQEVGAYPWVLFRPRLGLSFPKFAISRADSSSSV